METKEPESKEPESKESPTAERRIYGSFFLNESEFALPVTHVQEVVNAPGRYTSLPLSPPYLKGLFNLRGSIIPVVDSRVLLGLPGPDPAAGQKVVVLELLGHSIGLLFDRTGEVFTSRDEERNDFDDQASGGVVSGVFKKNDGKRLVQILDVPALFKLRNVPIHGEAGTKGRRAQLARNRGQKRQCISFVVGPARCALGIDEIREIRKIEKVDESALAVRHCIGAIDLRGTTVPVIDFAALLGYRDTDRTADATRGDRRVVVMRLGAELFGLLVDSVESIVSWFPDELLAFPVLQEDKAEMFVGCISRVGCDDVLLLDHRKVLSNTEIAEITHGHSKVYRSDQARETERKSRGGARKTYITFAVGTIYAVEIGDVKEIIDYPKTLLRPPGLPGHFRGIVNLRGELVTIVDARAMYSARERAGDSAGKVLVFKRNNVHFGLVVDSVEAIVTFTETDKMRLPDFLYKNDDNGLLEDITEAIHVNAGTEQSKSLLILDADAIAARVGKAFAA